MGKPCKQYNVIRVGCQFFSCISKGEVRSVLDEINKNNPLNESEDSVLELSRIFTSYQTNFSCNSTEVLRYSNQLLRVPVNVTVSLHNVPGTRMYTKAFLNILYKLQLK